MPLPESPLHRGRVADQITADLRRKILEGELPNGTRLPSARALATSYAVSSPTMREAIRALTTMGLLSTRGGSGSVVTANSDPLLRMSIASVAQFEKMRAGDLLELLAVLITYATQLAVERATEADIEQLCEVTAQTADVTALPGEAAALRQFFTTMAAMSQNPLLAALCKTLTEIQIGIAIEISAGDQGTWRRVATAMYPQRTAIAEAIARRDPTAPDLTRDYCRSIVSFVRTRPPTTSASILHSFLSTWPATGAPS